MNANTVSALTDFLPAVLPEAVLGVAACVLFLGGTWRAGRALWGGFALVALAAAALLLGVNAWGAARDRARLEGDRQKNAQTKEFIAQARASQARLRKNVADFRRQIAGQRPGPGRDKLEGDLAALEAALPRNDREIDEAEGANRRAVDAHRADLASLKRPPLGAATVEARQEYQAALKAFADEMLTGPAQEEARREAAAEGEALQALLYAAPVLPTRLALLIKLIALAGGALLVLLSWDEMPPGHAGDYHGCLLVIVAGMCLVGAANDLITLFLALELVSIPTYVLLYLGRVDAPAQEAAMKYFLLSVFSSALLLFGFSYLYGTAGTTNLPGLADALGRARADLAQIPEGQPRAAPWQGVTVVALVMVLAGLGFRIAAVPFHFYAPDVYQGTTSALAALLAFVPKVAGFAALIQVLGFVPGVLAGVPGAGQVLEEPVLLWIMAAVTMSLGNVLALLQDNLRRILAYSSVAHAGYMLIGLAVAPWLANTPGAAVGGVEALLFYLVAYGAMTVGAFGVLSYLDTRERPVETVDDLAGLGRSHPGLALLMALFLFSLIGIPLTAGFAGKFFLFFDALGVSGAAGELSESVRQQARLFRILAVIGVINAAIGAWYYLRIAAVMYLRDPFRPPRPLHSWPALASVWACAALTLFFGVYPAPLLRAVRAAVPRKALVTAPAAERIDAAP